ncbi:MAG: NAD(P)H-dependent oxidoreductase [Myxococcota bacterium]
MMRLAIVAGSQRPKSQTRRVCDYLAERAHGLLGAESQMVDLAQLTFPVVGQPETPESAKEDWAQASRVLSDANAIVVATPEWGGMATPAVKNLFQLAIEGEVAHKPALLVAVSVSHGGAYPIAELRMSSYKNTRICYIPEQVIVRKVRDKLQGQEPSSDDDRHLRDRIDYGLRMLDAYASALTSVRAAGLMDHERFTFGM